MRIETLSVTALAYGGAGVGRLADGMVCFIPGTLPGEEVKIRVTEVRKRFAVGELLTVSVPAPCRISPSCPLAGLCPGCVYPHCSYDTELVWKERQLEDFLLRGGAVSGREVFAAPFPAPQISFYRNKMTLHRDGSGAYGYFGRDNETILPVAECLLAGREINAILPEASGGRALFRCTAADGAQLIPEKDPPELTEYLPEAGSFRVSGDGFFQTNIPVAAELVREVKTALKTAGSRALLELYCGVGVFSIAAAERDGDLRCTGIEWDRRAVSCARKNAAAHRVADRCTFTAQDAGRALAVLRERPDTILLDPPRTGVPPETLDLLIASGAEHLLYISCAADTLARDLCRLAAAGYRAKRVRLLDMFPRTAHFEVLTVLEKK